MKRTLSSGLFSLALPLAAFAQGSLSPPGPPGETMRTLQQVEPRTPISSLPYYVSSRGSYYVTGDLAMASGGDGILIQASHVTLDLMGFTLSGNNYNGLGIRIGGNAAPTYDVVVRNGTLTGFGQGIGATRLHNARFENLAVFNNSLDGGGIRLENSSENSVMDCMVAQNGSVGGVYIHAFDGLAASYNRVERVTVARNRGDGIYISGSSGEACGNTVQDTTVAENAGAGIRIGASAKANENVVRRNTIRGNGSHGIEIAMLASGNRIEGNHIGGHTNGNPIQATAPIRNLMIANSAVNNTNAYAMGANNTYGPIVTNVGSLATSGAPAHPWANFSR